MGLVGVPIPFVCADQLLAGLQASTLRPGHRQWQQQWRDQDRFPRFLVSRPLKTVKCRKYVTQLDPPEFPDHRHRL